MSVSKVLMAGAFALTLSACAQPIVFQTTLTGSQEVPRTASNGTGTMTATLYPDTRALNYKVEYAGLTGLATAAHIHGPAAPGANGPVMVPFASAASPIAGSVTLTADQRDALMAGQTYVNVHTAANPGGEIRGQLPAAPR